MFLFFSFNLIDHYIYYRYFIPNGEPWVKFFQSVFLTKQVVSSPVKIQSFFKLNETDKTQVLMNIAIYADLYLNRSHELSATINALQSGVSPIGNSQLAKSMESFGMSLEEYDVKGLDGTESDNKKHPVGALAFEVTDELNEDNSVSIVPNSSLIHLKMTRKELMKEKEEAIMAELENITEQILKEFNLKPVGDHSSYRPMIAPQGGVAHEAGSLRLGSDPKKSVVDEDLKFHNVKNLWACDLSVLPESPAANPTKTLVALALRLGDHLFASEYPKSLEDKQKKKQ